MQTRNRRAAMAAGALRRQRAEVADLVANERRRIGMQIGDQKSSDLLAADLLHKILAFHDDIAGRDMKRARNGAAFERDRADFHAGVGVADSNAELLAQVARFRWNLLSP